VAASIIFTISPGIAAFTAFWMEVYCPFPAVADTVIVFASSRIPQTRHIHATINSARLLFDILKIPFEIAETWL
jgi:hypothetical protein